MNKDEQEAQLIAKNIKRFRAEWGISAAELAAIMGAPANTVQSWERGDRAAVKAIFRLADAFLRPAEHFRMEEPPPPQEPHPPAFGVVQVAREVDPALVRRVRDVVDDVNREHRLIVRRAAKAAEHAAFQLKGRTSAELGRTAAPASSSRSGKPSPAPPRQQDERPSQTRPDRPRHTPQKPPRST